MKFLGLILAAYVLLLTAVPCCAGERCDEKEQAGVAQASEKQHPQDCKSCSAFFACGSCTGFTLSESPSFFASMAVPSLVVYHTLCRVAAPVPVCCAIWQPPKVS
ncbi:DUF6660 family protein [Pontibacter chitinilyticus]|uniref:DUF6660 family protein n=1 Tax=Pontibacter chitinilyticus TaxID=2674989 RepID=UPI00321A85DD